MYVLGIRRKNSQARQEHNQGVEGYASGVARRTAVAKPTDDGEMEVVSEYMRLDLESKYPFALSERSHPSTR